MPIQHHTRRVHASPQSDLISCYIGIALPLDAYRPITCGGQRTSTGDEQPYGIPRASATTYPSLLPRPTVFSATQASTPTASDACVAPPLPESVINPNSNSRVGAQIRAALARRLATEERRVAYIEDLVRHAPASPVAPLLATITGGNVTEGIIPLNSLKPVPAPKSLTGVEEWITALSVQSTFHPVAQPAVHSASFPEPAPAPNGIMIWDSRMHDPACTGHWRAYGQLGLDDNVPMDQESTLAA
ncbi:hypothetical protein BOTBODRAFT_180237 [Botryobasidium botryosum FD-172 SS1]|uniref:Uncharacterized protein n=1 Tax=Botryobasidium botryosum (strain FD-172 SS1) TaxID=930990 RepID=A0A067M7Z9_BOTB1|nr:hypothetical protein BOTBODRAFT_180237 [Botryobasidium botryosum FD-172 SS1]